MVPLYVKMGPEWGRRLSISGSEKWLSEEPVVGFDPTGGSNRRPGERLRGSRSGGLVSWVPRQVDELSHPRRIATFMRGRLWICATAGDPTGRTFSSRLRRITSDRVRVLRSAACMAANQSTLASAGSCCSNNPDYTVVAGARRNVSAMS